MTQLHQEAPAEVTIDLLLGEVIKIKEKLADAKTVLKDYKIVSDRLTELKKVKKELQEQIKEEADRIEDEFYSDPTYEKAKNDQLTFKNQLKEKTSELKVKLAEKHQKKMEFVTDDRIVAGEQLKLQLEFKSNLYINGSKL